MSFSCRRRDETACAVLVRPYRNDQTAPHVCPEKGDPGSASLRRRLRCDHLSIPDVSRRQGHVEVTTDLSRVRLGSVHWSLPQGLPDVLKTSAPPGSRTDPVVSSEATTACIEFARSIATSASACNPAGASKQELLQSSTASAAPEALRGSQERYAPRAPSRSRGHGRSCPYHLCPA